VICCVLCCAVVFKWTCSTRWKPGWSLGLCWSQHLERGPQGTPTGNICC